MQAAEYQSEYQSCVLASPLADTPPRSIGADYYPNLLALYQQAGVEVEKMIWDYSIATASPGLTPFIRASSCPGFAWSIPTSSSVSLLAKIIREALR
jgi:hypothetical protein